MSEQKIIIDTRLSLKWHRRDEILNSEQIDFNNAPVIQLLDVLEAQQSSKLLKSINNKDSQSNQSELSRLESKIDLLIMLFSRNQYNQQYNKIANFELRLSADCLHIKTSETLALNQFVEIEIFFNQTCPEPLIFFGKVMECKSPDTLAINFCDAGRLTQLFLEKFIFRLHRNEVARIRHS